MNTTIPQARVIGGMIRDARLENGYTSRSSLVGTKKLKNRLTQEGLRKIEQGERVPRLENLHLLCSVLGISKKKTTQMERLALEANIQRATKAAGNATVSFKIEGKPVKMYAVPPKRRTETFVRDVVGELVTIVRRYGVLDEDVDHFRRHARSALLKRMR